MNSFSKSENKFKHRKALRMLEALLCFFYVNISLRKTVTKHNKNDFSK